MIDIRIIVILVLILIGALGVFPALACVLSGQISRERGE